MKTESFTSILTNERWGQEEMTMIAKPNNILNIIKDGLFMTDKAGMITFVNEQLAEMYGFDSPDEMIGKHFSEFISPEFRTEISEKFKKAVEDETFSDVVEFRTVRKDGASIFLQLKHGPIIENGQIVGTAGVIRDVTDLKRAEQALAASEKTCRAILENMRYSRETFISYTIRNTSNWI